MQKEYNETWHTYPVPLSAETLVVALDNEGKIKRIICRCGGANSLENAKFICAARDSYFALRDILDIGKRDISNPKYDAYVNAANSAIKRAEG